MKPLMDTSELTGEQRLALATIDMMGQLIDAMDRMMTLMEGTRDRLRQLEETYQRPGYTATNYGEPGVDA